ncbi:MAG: YaiO family outer membrane beta-barrel protein [Pricia sp.]
MGQKNTYLLYIFVLSCFVGVGQDMAYKPIAVSGFEIAYTEASKGNHGSAQNTLLQIVAEHPDDLKARALLASTYSWSTRYDEARDTFNAVTSQEKNNREVWISSIKNELYAKRSATALGLSNKALMFITGDSEIERLREMALQQIRDQKYPETGWFDQGAEPKAKRKEKAIVEQPKVIDTTGIVPISPVDKDVLNNRLSIRNAYTVFDQRYDPIIASSVSYKRQTLAGSIIPRINYNHRNKIDGVQYELDFYPKFSKRFYAYLNYGISKASIYPNSKVGGDLYVNLPGAMEFSAGGRHINFDTQDVSVVTNSLGHYRGNYYFSLRSYITPLPDRLTRVSGNLLVRKYGKDAENYMGLNVGMGYSPELRQLISGDELLAETLLYVASQRLSFEYQFTGKNSPNIYRANMGITRQELAFDSGNYFWSVMAGLTYQVKF